MSASTTWYARLQSDESHVLRCTAMRSSAQPVHANIQHAHHSGVQHMGLQVYQSMATELAMHFRH